ncbi:MAG: hypothetical protein KDD41_07370 [Flavobacteriales bacterium]|nr:hypothetical protein [Flavobacteriales bacterium]
MKFLNLALTAALCITFGVSNGQNNAATGSKTSQINQASTDVNDDYMGKKEKILRMLNVKEIPATFPKYTAGLSEQDYRMQVKSWLEKNEQFWSDEYKKKRDEKVQKRQEARKQAQQK